ncbi:unnamed protein product [Alopecurus aequalis]
MEMDISLLQERGTDRGQMSRFHVRSPAVTAPATSITLVSNSHAGLFPETEMSDEEQHPVVPNPQETVPARHTIVPRRVHEKRKEPEVALKQICGICLSEEQRATLQGLLNCCSHYFCFTCILEWSKAESRCPSCKRRFNTITVADVGSGLRSTAIRVEKRDQVYQPTEEETNPVETPDEDRRAQSHIAAEPVSTTTGRQATLERTRARNRRVRMLLFRPRAATNARQHGIESFREVADAKDQLIPIVKKSIKHICAQPPLDQSAFADVARRATHTILALSGIAHNSDRVVAVPFPFPGHCYHARDGREPAFLASTICSTCFECFVGDVVEHIANMSP